MEESLRERKKRLTRRRILDEAERLFERNGFDDVTVAEIANAADISVKTLFVYFRSKEDLAFGDDTLIEAVLEAVRDRGHDRTPAAAAAEVLAAAALRGGGSGLEGYRRGYAGSSSLVAGLARMWARYEDRLTDLLAEERGGPATSGTRLEALQIVALIRSTTSEELADEVRGLSKRRAAEHIAQFVTDAAQSIRPVTRGRPHN